MSAGQVALITGATRGIGRALALELGRRGHRVFGAGRSWTPGEELPFVPVVMDVTDEESVRLGVERVIQAAGRIDVLVNNAGISHCGPVEDTPLAIARGQFETNYFGLTRVVRAVLPAMRARAQGTIVAVGSAAGQIGVPFQAHYAASKFAVEGLMEALRHELAGFGIRVLLVEPGDVRTAIWQSREQSAAPDSAYAAALKRFLAVKDREMGESAATPEAAAREIADLIESDTCRFRHPAGKGARFILLARKLLPDRIFLWAVARNYRLTSRR